MNELALLRADTSWSTARGLFRERTVTTTHTFDDLVVDGRPVRDQFAMDTPNQMVTPLSDGSRSDAALAVTTIDALLGDQPGPYADGCVPVLFCGVDTDAYCGALGVIVTATANRVHWAFGWHLLDGDGSVETHTPPLPAEPADFDFEREAYEAVLRPARERYRSIAKGATPYTFVP